MKKDEKFFNWLNQRIFYKNILICKEDYDTKRVMDCEKHKLEGNFKKFNKRV